MSVLSNGYTTTMVKIHTRETHNLSSVSSPGQAYVSDLNHCTNGVVVGNGSSPKNQSENQEKMQLIQNPDAMEVEVDSSQPFTACSTGCLGCRELGFIAHYSNPEASREKIVIPVPPVVLVGQPPDTSVLNAWPPFGCRGRGECRSGSFGGPIRRRNRAHASEEPAPPTKIHCKNIQYPFDAFLAMNEMRRSSGHLLCDVKIQAGPLIFPAHRVVLAASSAYFRAMFTMNMKEAKEEVVKIENICPKILGKLIDFCYTSEITIGERFICKILPAAVMLQMQHVIDCCCHFLQSQLDPCNAIGIAEFANQHGCTNLTSIAREFIDKHFAEVSQNEEFLQLNVCQLINLIKRDELVVNTESEVYHAVMRWIKYDEKNRRPHLENVVYVVRCYFLPPSFLEQQIKSCDMLKSYPQCRQYLQRIMTDLTAHKKCQMRKRRNPDLPMVIYIVGGYLRYSLNRLECFDPKLAVWRSLSSMPTFRSGVTSAFVHGLLYVAGGRCTLPDTNTDSSAVDAYDPFTDSWRSCTPMSTQRNRAGAVAIDNLLYVVGGSAQTEFHSSGERYNPNDETWTPIASMHRKRLGLGVASLNRLLYAVGGFDGSERLQSVECYDPDLDEWHSVSPMQTRRSGAGVVSLDGMLYAIGGYDGRMQLATVERYDSEANKWEYIASMTTARSALGVVAVDGKIFAIGGYDGNEFSAVVESYDPDMNEWAPEKSLPEGRSGHGVAVWWGSCCYAHDNTVANQE